MRTARRFSKIIFLSSFIGLSFTNPLKAQTNPPVKQWQATLDKNTTDKFYCIKQTWNSDFLACGYTVVGGKEVPCIARYTSSGKQIWSNTYSQSQLNLPNTSTKARFLDLMQRNGSGFVVVGYGEKFDGSNNSVRVGLFLNLDDNGNIITTPSNQAHYITKGGVMDATTIDSYNLVANSIRQLPDGGFIIGGSSIGSTAAEGEGFIARYDGNFSFQWYRSYGTVTNAFLTGLNHYALKVHRFEKRKNEILSA